MNGAVANPRVAAVTGANRAIGRATAIRQAQDFGAVAPVARIQASLKAIAPKAAFAAVGTINAAIAALAKTFAERGLADRVQVNAMLPAPVLTDRRRAMLQRYADSHGLPLDQATKRIAAESGITRFRSAPGHRQRHRLPRFTASPLDHRHGAAGRRSREKIHMSPTMNQPAPSWPSGYAARPDYHVALLQRPNRFEARAGGRVIAASDRAILVDEQDHALVVYFPRADVDMASLVPLAAKRTHCPFKGDANYWTVAARLGEPVAWSYLTPFPEVAGIAGHIAFYHDRVDIFLGAKRS